MALLPSTVQRMVECPSPVIDQTPRLATVVGLMIHGVGPTMAAILVAEIRDVAPVSLSRAVVLLGAAHRPHRGSDARPYGVGSPSQDSKLAHWALIEAVSTTTEQLTWWPGSGASLSDGRCGRHAPAAISPAVL
jgi:hypothetical protein